jgi:hypothetical protein
MTTGRGKTLALVRAWLVLDFFGEARRAGKGHASSLTTTIFSQAFLAFVVAALLYGDTPPVPFAAANLCLSSLLIAIGALGDDSRPERHAADQLLLQTAPLSRWTVVLARAGHAAFATLLVTIGMALSPAILLALATHDVLQLPGYLLAACLCSALATGALGVLARAGHRWLGSNRTALLLGSLKALVLGGGLVLFALGLTRLRGTAAELPIGRIGAELLPPYQLARWLAAPVGEVWRLGAVIAAGALLLAAAAALPRTADAARARAARPGLALRLLRAMTPPGRTRALAEFTAVQMWRSAGFRARVLPLLGVPAAMVALAVRGGNGDGDSDGANDFVLTCVLVQLPAIYLPFLVMFLPRADQPGTRWVFDHAPALDLACVRDGVWRAVVTHVLVPVFVLALLAPPTWGAALPPTLFAFGVAVFAARAATRALHDVPFTAEDDGGGSPELGALFAGAIVLGGLGAAFALVVPPSWRWPTALVVLAAAILSLRPRWSARAAQAREASVADVVRADGAAPGASAAAAPATSQAAADDEDPATAPRPPATLARELRAIATLYALLCVLPLLVGTFFAA